MDYITYPVTIGEINGVVLEDIGYTAHCKYINGDCHWRVMFDGQVFMGGVSSNKEFAIKDCRKAVSNAIRNGLININKETQA